MKSVREIFAENLLELIEKKKIEQRDLAIHLGVSDSSITHWIKGNKYPRMDKIQQMADFFNVPKSRLTEENKKTLDLPSTQYEYFSDLKISAGLPQTVDGITNHQTINVPDFVLKHYAGNKGIFFAHINGESMNKIIQDGALIAVKKTDIDNLKNGDIVVYSCCHEYAVKRFYRTDNGVLFKPESTDYTFKDHEITGDNLTDLVIYGKVIYYGTTI